MHVLGVRTVVACFMKEAIRFIMMKWQICFLIFLVLLFEILAHWINISYHFLLLYLLTIFIICCGNVLICALYWLSFLCSLGWGLESASVIWSYLYSVLCISKDWSRAKSRISFHTPEVWLRLRFTSSGSTTYALGLTRSESGDGGDAPFIHKCV